MEFQKFVTDFLSKMQDEDPASAFTKEGQALTDLSRQQDLDTRESQQPEEQSEVTDVEELTESNLSSLTPKSEPARDSASFETSVPEAEDAAPEVFTGDEAKAEELDQVADMAPDMDSAAFETALTKVEPGAEAEVSEAPRSSTDPAVPTLFLSQDQQLPVDAVSVTTDPGPEVTPNAQPEVPDLLKPVFNDMIAEAQSQFPEGMDNIDIREPGIELPPLPDIPEDIFMDNKRIHKSSGEFMQRDRR